MVNYVSQANEIQKNLQEYAAQGLLSLKKRSPNDNNQWGMVTSLAIGIILNVGALVTASMSLTIAVPVVLGIAGIGLTAYGIYCFVQNKILKRNDILLSLIFNDITNASFGVAMARLEDLSKEFMGKSVDVNMETSEKCNEFENKFNVENLRWTQSLNFKFLHSSVAVLKALGEISNGAVKTKEEIQEVNAQIKKWGDHMRCGLSATQKWCALVDTVNKLQNPKGAIKFSSIKPNGAFVLLGLIDNLKTGLNEHHFKGNDPSKWGGGAWIGNGQDTLKYIKLIKIAELENLDQKSLGILNEFLKCNNLKEIWQYATSIPESTLKDLEAKTK